MKKELPRTKKLSVLWRLVFAFYFYSRKFLPKRIYLQFLLNLNWVTNRLAYDQHYYQQTNLEALRPENYTDFLIELLPEDSVCDYGAGSGELTRKISEKCRKVTYVDSNSETLRIAKESLFGLTNVEFETPTELFMPDHPTFDVIVLSHVLEHIDDRIVFLLSLHRLTSRVCIEVPDLDSSALNYLRISLGLPLWTDEDHVVEMNLKSLEELLHESNWQVQKSKIRGGTIFVSAKRRLR